jgi:citrate synthase
MAKKKIVKIVDSHSSNEIEVPVLEPTIGSSTLDIRQLHQELGYFSFDPGYVCTSSCESKITYIDGDEGQLSYRGYPIEQLAEHSNFPEVCYLLLNGELPAQSKLEEFNKRLKDNSNLPNEITKLFEGFSKDTHPMAMLMASLAYLASIYHKEINVHDHAYQKLSSIRSISKVATIAAWNYRYTVEKSYLKPLPNLTYTENFLYMMFGNNEDYRPDPLLVKALDIIFVLHADHEQNASTSTVRLSGSSETSPFAALAAGVATLWGPTHGGANEAVINMLEEIIHSNKPIDEYIARAKDRDDKFRLMGFGHRIYKNYDPRAKIINDVCHDVLAKLGADNPNKPLFDVAMKLEKIALEDEYFVERKLYPNVDFYSGIILQAIGIPAPMFTVIFAIARTSGWISHWMEMMRDPHFRIGRPRQLYTGPANRDFVAIDKRK